MKSSSARFDAVAQRRGGAEREKGREGERGHGARVTRELLEKRPSMARGMFAEPLNTAAFRRCTCGAPARLVQMESSRAWVVTCDCGARGQVAHGPATAIQNWNRGLLGFSGRSKFNAEAQRREGAEVRRAA
jgi:hypothetical protein